MITKKAKAFGGTVRSCAVSVISVLSAYPSMIALTSFETQVGNDSWRKVPERIERVGHEEVTQSKRPELPRRERLYKVLLVEMLVCALGRERAHSVHGEFAFFFCEEFRRFRVVGHEEVDEDAPDDSGDTFEDEPAYEHGFTGSFFEKARKVGIKG